MARKWKKTKHIYFNDLGESVSFKVCARCKHIYLKYPCKCKFGTYQAVHALGLKDTILGWILGQAR